MMLFLKFILFIVGLKAYLVLRWVHGQARA